MTDLFSVSFAHLHLLKHPFYQAWMEGTLPLEVLQNYAIQYYHHVDRFPRYLGAIHSQCENTVQRQKILENLNDEEGTKFGLSHPELWLQFAEGLGVKRADVLATKPGQAIQNVAATFFQNARSSFQEGIGALYAYESQVPEIAESKIAGLKSQYGIHDAKTLEFFEVHRQADVEHRAVILAMLESLSPQEKLQAQDAAKAAALSLWNFLSEMNGRQEACA